MMELEPLPCRPEPTGHTAYPKYSSSSVSRDAGSAISPRPSPVEYPSLTSPMNYRGSRSMSPHQSRPRMEGYSSMLDADWMPTDSGGVSSSGTDRGSFISSPESAVSPSNRRVNCQNERCRVCGDEATGMYFGAIVCVPCKTFFLRYAGDNFGFVCKYSRECEISVASRTQCKFCRYQKCIEAGMCRRERPAQIQISEGQQQCVVCSDLANGVHFGAITCEGCKKFFRRGLQEHSSYTCKGQKDCIINPRTRNSCRSCRYQKCLNAGMSREAIQMGRPAKVRTLGSSAGVHKDKSACASRSDPSVSKHTGPYSQTSSNNSSSMVGSPGSKVYSSRQRYEPSQPYPIRVPPPHDVPVDQDRMQVMSLPPGELELQDVDSMMGHMFRPPHDSAGTPDRKPMLPGQESMCILNSPSQYNQSASDLLSQSDFLAGSSSSNRKQSRLKALIAEILSIKQEPMYLDEPSVNQQQQFPSSSELPSREQGGQQLTQMSPYPGVNMDSPAISSSETQLSSPLHSSLSERGSDQYSQGWPGVGGEAGVAQPPLDIIIKQEPLGTDDDLELVNEGLFVDIYTDDLLHNNPIDKISREISESPSNPSTPSSVIDLFGGCDEITSKSTSNRACNHNLLLSSLLQLANQIPLNPTTRQEAVTTTTAITSSSSGCRSNSLSSPPTLLSPSAPKMSVHNNISSRCWNHLDFNQCKEYWRSGKLPDENLMFEAKHQVLIDQVMPAYHRFVATGTSINKQLRNQLPLWMEKHGIGLEAAQSLLPDWINSKVVPVFTLTSFTFCRDLPGFLELNQTDQATLIRLGQSQSRILVASVHWFNREENDFRDFLAWRTMEAGQEDKFKKKLVLFAKDVDKLQVDTIEAALLNALVVVATDYPGLLDLPLVEGKRINILRAFRAYTTAKLGTPNSRIEDLFNIVPKLRELGLIHHRMTVSNPNPPAVQPQTAAP